MDEKIVDELTKVVDNFIVEVRELKKESEKATKIINIMKGIMREKDGQIRELKVEVERLTDLLRIAEVCK